MKHIFLTGEIQVGKSTALRRALELLGLSYGGFQTYFGADRGEAHRCLYLGAAGEPRRYDEGHVVARFSPGGPPFVYPERFDALGAALIDDAKRCQLIVMDELGRLEREAFAFRKAAMSALDGDVPILGVVAQNATGWVEEVRGHHKVTLITVDEENRDGLPRQCARWLAMTRE